MWTFARPRVDIHPALIDKAESAIQINLLWQRVQYAETTACGAGGTQCRQYHLRCDSLLSHFRERRHIVEIGDGLIPVGAEQTDFYQQILGSFSGGATKARKKPSNLRRMIELNVDYTDDKVAAIDAMNKYWAGAFLPALYDQKIYTPKMSARNGEAVGSDAIQQKTCIFADPRAYFQFAKQYPDLGFTDL